MNRGGRVFRCARRAGLPAALALFAAYAALVLPEPEARGDAPSCLYTIPADLLTAKDEETGLVWLRDVSPSMYTQADAKTYCETLADAGGGWRLPTIAELDTLVDESRSEPAIDPVAFPSSPAGFFWSSTVEVGGNGRLVQFFDGSDASLAPSSPARVRCVR